MVDFVKKYYLYIIVVVMTFTGLLMVFIPSGDEPLNQNDFNPNVHTPDSNVINYIYVDIKGAVFNPGVYKVENNTRLFQAIAKAGGLLEAADNNAINLSMLLKDEQVVYIPEEGEEFPNVAICSDDSNDLVNINTASKSQLETLPGVGPSTAQSIIDYREGNGEFSLIEDIMNVTGIGETTFNDIKDFITT